jgi:hypothetical protein
MLLELIGSAMLAPSSGAKYSANQSSEAGVSPRSRGLRPSTGAATCGPR